MFGDTSSIDNGLEIIEVVLERSATEGLGFNIRGGTDMPHMIGDSGIFITKLRENGSAAVDGRLAEGDKIIEINGNSLENLDHRTAVTMFKKSGHIVRLKVVKNAEQALTARSKKVTSESAPKNSTAVLAIGLSAILIIGLGLYKCRGNLSSFLQRFTSSRQDPARYARVLVPSHPPYNP